MWMTRIVIYNDQKLMLPDPMMTKKILQYLTQRMFYSKTYKRLPNISKLKIFVSNPSYMYM